MPRLLIACLLSALTLATFSPAKPPDLPNNPTVFIENLPQQIPVDWPGWFNQDQIAVPTSFEGMDISTMTPEQFFVGVWHSIHPFCVFVCEDEVAKYVPCDESTSADKCRFWVRVEGGSEEACEEKSQVLILSNVVERITRMDENQVVVTCEVQEGHQVVRRCFQNSDGSVVIGYETCSTTAIPVLSKAVESKPTTSCPYKPCDARAAAIVEAGEFPSVLDNLSRLEKAGEKLKKAKALARKGKTEKALELLEKVRVMCPGSTYEKRAKEVYEEICACQYGPWCEFTISTHDDAVGEEGCSESDTNVVEPEGCVCLPCVGNACLCCFDRAVSWCCSLPQPVAGSAAHCPTMPCQVGYPGWMQAPVSIAFDNTPLRVVLERIRETHRANIVLDIPALQNQGFDLYIPVTVHVKDMPMHVFLEQWLPTVRLRCEVKGDAALIKSNLPDCHSCPVQGQPATGCEMRPCLKAQQMHEEYAKNVMVDGLMKACHLAVEGGRHDKAVDLAHQAHAIDPQRVADDPMVWKLHLLMPRITDAKCHTETCPAAGREEATEPQGTIVPDTGEEEKEEGGCPLCAECGCCPCAQLWAWFLGSLVPPVMTEAEGGPTGGALMIGWNVIKCRPTISARLPIGDKAAIIYSTGDLPLFTILSCEKAE